MTDPLSTLRELVTNWKADVLKYGCTIHLGVDELEALLTALEQRERELRLDEALKFQVATFEAGFVFKFAEKRVAELRAAFNPTEAK